MKQNFQIICRLCKQEITILADPKDIIKWHNNEGYVQKIFHYLTADERELLISQTCGKCFDELFPQENI